VGIGRSLPLVVLIQGMLKKVEMLAAGVAD